MALPTVTPPPVAPTTEDPIVFPGRADQLVAWLATHASEEAALVAWMSDQISALNSLFAGGGFALPYYFDSITADGDPGAGKIRFSSANQASSGMVRIDLTTGATQDATALLDDMTSSTSTIKGKMRIVKVNDPSKWMVFNVTAKASPAGYRNISATPIQYSSANPFTAGDPLLVTFTPNGDKGDTGLTGPTYSFPVLHVREERASGSAATETTLSGWTNRTLNTTKVNSIPGASLASNQFTLPAGTYYLRGVTTATNSGNFGMVTRLRNVTDGVTTLVGPNSPMTSGAGVAPIEGQFVLAAAKTFNIQTYVGGGVITGGSAIASGEAEVYSEVFIQKVA